MKTNLYVSSHNFGYGTQRKRLNKLSLRNIDDVEAYVYDIIQTQLIAKCTENKLTFQSDGTKERFLITHII